MIKAIETIYNEYRFRSRLEARWAVFFDAMGFEWEYEKEGYDLGNLGWYLPDFWLPMVKMWAEVKPEKLSDTEHAKCEALVRGTGYPCLMLIGTPSKIIYDAICLEEDENGVAIFVKWNLVLSNHHNYYDDEKRFFTNPGNHDEFLFTSEDMVCGVNAARQARFEHGENGISKNSEFDHNDEIR